MPTKQRLIKDYDPNLNEATILRNNHGRRKIHTEVVVVDYTVPEGKNKTKLVMVYNQMGYLSTCYCYFKRKRRKLKRKQKLLTVVKTINVTAFTTTVYRK